MYPHDACVDSRESKASRLQFVPSLACVCRFALRARVNVPVLRQSPEHLFGFVPGRPNRRLTLTRARTPAY